MKALHLLFVLSAACAGESQIVLELTGGVPGAEQIEVLLLDPLVMAKRQLHNRPDPATPDRLETVFYMAERSRTTFELGGAATEGLRFEIQGADGPYVPLVAARAGERVLALGLYNPASVFAAELGREHAPAAVAPVGDVTIFPIALEPVDRTLVLSSNTAPQPVQPREVMAVPCGAGGALSGFAWRRADLHQLRVLLASPSRQDAGAGKDLLDPPDLDCDEHSPGPGGVLRISVGDERDCDDTAPAIHGGAHERCSTFDEDCNSQTTLSPVACAGTCATSPVCFCDDNAGAGEPICPTLLGVCNLPSVSSGGAGLLPCESGGFVLLPCQGGCEVLLEAVPEGLEIGIGDEMIDSGQGPGKWVSITDGKAWVSIKGSASFSTPELAVAVRVKTAIGTSPPFVLSLKLAGDGQCPDPSQLACTTP